MAKSSTEKEKRIMKRKSWTDAFKTQVKKSKVKKRRYSNIAERRLEFGKYKGQKFLSIPNNYLRWLLDRNYLKGLEVVYAKVRLKIPKYKYAVALKISDTSVKTYYVYAYNLEQARNEVAILLSNLQLHTFMNVDYTMERVEE